MSTLDVETALLGIATIKAIQCRCATSTRQLLREVAGGDDKIANRLMYRIHSGLDWQSRQWLKNTMLPGVSDETPAQAAERIHQQYADQVYVR